MYTITRKFTFDSAHRVFGHEGKCANLHGHRYVAEIFCCPNEDLDSLGRVVDFSVIKELVGKWIDTEWDHNTILHPKDQQIADSINSTNLDRHCFFLVDPFTGEPLNPTAENMAMFLFYKASELLLPFNIVITQVILHETDNCKASYVPHNIRVHYHTNKKLSEKEIEEIKETIGNSNPFKGTKVL